MRRDAWTRRTARTTRVRYRKHAGRCPGGCAPAGLPSGRPDPPCEPRALSDRAVHGDPGHDLRIGVMPGLSAGLPRCLDPAGPRCLKVPDQGRVAVPAGLIVAKAAATRLMQRVHDFAINVQLKLLRGGVADPDGICPIVSGKPGNLPFRQPPFPGKPVHDLKLVGIAGRRPEKPRPPCIRLVVVSGVHQRQQRDRGVPQPAEPVIPVPHPAGLLRQRRGRRRHDAAGRAVGQRLENGDGRLTASRHSPS